MIGRRAKPSATEADKPKGFDDFELRLGDLMRGERATLGKSLLDVQRELKIKATYIAAIENCDVSAFETPGFISGYVKSYARYLGMDPEFAFKRFCAEAGFTVAHGMSAAASSPDFTAKRAQQQERGDPLFNPNATFIPRSEGFLSRIEPGAVGSLLVLAVLIGAIGYGGWSVLQEVQRVQLAPVDQAPAVAVDIDPLAGVTPAPVQTAEEAAAEGTDLAALDPVGAAAQAASTDRLSRPQALDVPVLTSRDGPISAIDPRATGTLATAQTDELSSAVDLAVAEAVGDEVKVVEEPKTVEILAVRPSWIRVQSADGTVLFEKILNAGERYAVPQLESPALLRAGNSGSIYFTVGDKTYGPAATGGSVVKNVALSPEAVTEKYTIADLSRDRDLGQFVNVAEATTAATGATTPVAE
jgi:cytoskeletal protein RodZ